MVLYERGKGGSKGNGDVDNGDDRGNQQFDEFGDNMENKHTFPKFAATPTAVDSSTKGQTLPNVSNKQANTIEDWFTLRMIATETLVSVVLPSPPSSIVSTIDTYDGSLEAKILVASATDSAIGSIETSKRPLPE